MEKASRGKFLVALVAFVATPGSVFGDITTGSWILSQSNTFADGVDYGTVDIEADSTLGTIKFKVDATTAPYADVGTNFGIDKFAFNFQNLTDTPTTWTVALPTGWSEDDDGGTLAGFGQFLVIENGTTRQDPLEFTITLSSGNESQAVVDNFVVNSTGTADQGHVFFVAHIAGFNETTASADDDSHFAGAPIPTPDAVVLAGMGLGLVGWVRRRFS